MRKLIRIAFCSAIVFYMLLSGASVYAASVQVSLPTFHVTLNGKQIENAERQYPLIVYHDITYFPMTYYDCGFLGLDSYYSPQTGLLISRKNRAIIPWSYHEYEPPRRNPQFAAAQIAAFPIYVNEKEVENSKEEYPLLLYKDITYFPLIWRYAVEEFDWDYMFYDDVGLVINSFKEEDIKELIIDIYGNDVRDIVSVISDNIKTSEWVNYSFSSYSRHENRVTGLLSEYRPGGTRWYRETDMTGAVDNDNSKNPHVISHLLQYNGSFYKSSDGKRWNKTDETIDGVPGIIIPDLAEMLSRLPDRAFENVGWGYIDGYPRMTILYIDEIPTSMPLEKADGSITAGGIKRYEYFIDLNEGCLRSYRVSTLPFYIGEEGKYDTFAPSTSFYNVIDLNYKPVNFPIP